MTVKQCYGFLSSQSESFTDYGWMHVLFDEIFRTLEEFSREDNSRSGSIIAMLLLCFCNLNDHFCCRMLNVHFLENGSAIVRNDNVTHGIHEHFVHPFRAQCGTHRICYRFRSSDVVRLSATSSRALRTFFEDENWCLSISVHVVHLLSRAGCCGS